MKKDGFYLLTRILKRILVGCTRIVFKIEVRGLENIPQNGGALVVSNHVSYLDNLVLIAAIPRDLGFVMVASVYRNPMLNWLVKRLPMVPIESGQNKDYLDEFNANCQSIINDGNLVCIYPEGQISRNGHLLAFKKGVEHVAKGLSQNIPIIPIHIDGLLGTPLSYDNVKKKSNKFIIKNLYQPITVTIGAPMDNKSTAFELRQMVKELEVKNFAERIPIASDLIQYLSLQLAKWDSKKAIGAHTADQLWTYAQLFASKHKNKLTPYELVGVHLKKQADNTIANIALTMLGKQAINFVGEVETQQLQEAGVEFLISESDFEMPSLVYKLPTLEGNIVQESRELFKNQVVAKFNSSRDFYAMTHENLLAYFYALRQLFPLDISSKILCNYNTDTAIGYFIKVWIPLLSSSQLLENHSLELANVLVGNADFINNYHQKYGSKHLRTVILLDDSPEDLAFDFNLEAVYQGLRSHSSCPVLALSSPDFVGKSIDGKSIVQEGRKEHAVGRPLPGVALKITNMTGENVGSDVFGQVWAKGALFSEKGWINSGITGKLTNEGFLVI